MPDRVAHLPHLAVPSFANGDEQAGGGRPAAPEQSYFCRSGRPAFEHEAPPQAREIALVGTAEHAGLVDPLDSVARVREPSCEIAVVGQHEQALRVEIEPPDGIDVVADAHQVDHGWSLLRI